MSSGLKKIFLHDSYIHGRLVCIPCEGHTNLIGGNGAGKTSALKLLPIFYGQDPGRMMERTASRDNFLNYYLPRQQSMLIFEYVRLNGDTCCAVFCRNSTDASATYIYRFVSGSADETVLHPDVIAEIKAQNNANATLHRTLRERGIDVTRQITSTQDYRAILQNDLDSLKKRATNDVRRGYRAIARQYSLGSPDDKLKHIHDLTSVAMRSTELISQLKSMIVDTQIAPHTQIMIPHASLKNADLWRHLSGLREFAKVTGRLEAGIDLYRELQDIRASLAQYTLALEQQIAEADSLKEAKAQTLSERQQTLADTRTHHSQRLDELSRLKAEVDAQVSEQRRLVKGIYDKRDYWEDLEIEDVIVAYRDLPQLREDLRNAESHRNALLREGQEARDEFLQHINDVTDKHSRKVKRLHAEISEVQQQITTLMARHAHEENAAKEAYALQRDEMKSEAALEVAEYREQFQALSDEINAVYQSATSPSSALAQSTAALRQAEADLREIDAQVDQTQRELGAHRQQLMQAERALEQAERAYHEAVNAHEAIHAKRYPTSGTLLAFLRKHRPEWGETLGKIIHPDLLARTDLSPAVTDPDAMSAYGVLLDLEVLDRPEAAMEEAELDFLVERAQHAISLAKTDKEEAEKQVASLRKQQGTTDAQLQVQRTRKTSLQARIVEFQQQEAEARHAEAQERQRQIERLKQRQQAIRDAEKVHQGKTEQKLSAFKDSHDQAFQQLRASHALAMSTLENTREAKEQQIRDADAALATQRKELEKARDEALRARGIDTRMVSEAEQRINALRTEITRLEGQEGAINSYQHWLENYWSTIQARERDLHEAETRQLGLQQDQDKQKALAQEAIKRLSEEIAELQQAIRQQERTLSDWSELAMTATKSLSRVPADPSMHAEANSTALGSGDQVAKEASRLTEALSQRTEQVVETATECQNVILSNPDTPVFDTWANLSNHLKQTTGYAAGSEAFRIASMHQLSELLNEHLPNIERGILVQIKEIARGLDQYHVTMDRLSRTIRHLSNQLYTKLNTEHDFDAISDVRIKLISLVSDDEHWKPLDAFVANWQRWLRLNERGLPPNELLDDLRFLDEAFRNGKVNASNLDSLIGIEISLTENGRHVPIRTDNDLKDSSSGGLSVLATLIIFSALTRYLCPNEDIQITWPIDELGRIDPGNIRKLFEMMKKRNISVFCAQPNASTQLLKRFVNKMKIDKTHGVTFLTDPDRSSRNRFLRQAEAVPVEDDA